MKKLTFELLKAARKSGGDRYQCQEDPQFQIYFPQSISRPDGRIKQIIRITVED